MGDKTGIAWTDSTWNPVRGCSRVGPGCENCYAEGVAARFSGTGQPYEGLARFSERRLPQWTGEVRFIDKHLADPLRWKKPRRIFVNSMSDLFHEKLSNEEISAVFGVMAAAPRHTFQVLTKRPERAIEWLAWAEKRGYDGAALFQEDDNDWRIRQMVNVAALRRGAHVASNHGGPWPLPNVCIGVTAEDQKRADERVPLLLKIPAAVRFVSVEPQLGAVSLQRLRARAAWPKIDWVICGGESGHRARPFDLAWARSLRDECEAAGVAFFMKQIGARRRAGEFFDFNKWVNHARRYIGGKSAVCVDKKGRACKVGADFMRARDEGAFPVAFYFKHQDAGADPNEWPEDLRVQRFPEVRA